MATKSIVSTMTALEVARRSSDPDALTIIETMAMANTMLQELPAVEANDGTVHTSVVRRSYPGGQHRVYNQGVGAKSSQTDTVKDMTCILESFSDVDHQLAKNSGNEKALYDSEAKAFLFGMGQDQADDLVYGNNAQDPALINGLAIRYSKLGERCISFGGTGKNLTSLYLIAAGPKACHLIYPKGSKSVGVIREDLGVNRVPDPKDNQRTFMAHTDHFIAEYGLAIAHPDAVIRICNIPLDLTDQQRQDLLEIILRYQKRLTKGIVNTALFANGDLIYQLERAGRELSYVTHDDVDSWGKPITSINGLRFRGQDAILSAEDEVAA